MIIVQIEDYNGNDLCKFQMESNTDLSKFHIYQLQDCNLADIDTDEQGNTIYRIQLN